MHLCRDPSKDRVAHLVLHGLENLSLLRREQSKQDQMLNVEFC